MGVYFIRRYNLLYEEKNYYIKMYKSIGKGKNMQNNKLLYKIPKLCQEVDAILEKYHINKINTK